MKRMNRKSDSARQEGSIVAKTPPRIVSYAPGSTWLVGTSRVTIQCQRTAHEVVVRHTDTGHVEKLAIGLLAPVAPEAPPKTHDASSQRPLEQHSDATWSRALEEEAQVARLVQAGDISPAARAKVASHLGISDRQLRRKLKRFGELQTAAAFLPQQTGPVPGKCNLHPQVEMLLQEHIAQALRDSPDVAVDDLHPAIAATAKAMGLRPPGRTTVSRRLRAARARGDDLAPAVRSEVAYRRKVVRGAHTAEAPLHIVEMDHTVVDAHIVEPSTGMPLGRPVLTLAIDRATRVVVGMLLGLEAPSRFSVGLCLHHGVMPKQAWLQSLGIPEACWPGFGLMHQIYTDNASEFHALSLRRACEIYGITVAFRPPGDPAAGGIIERHIGTFMTKVRLLPGSSFSKLLGQATKSAHRDGRFTLSELELYLAREVSRYHKTTHGGIGKPPLTAWEQGWTVNGVVGAPRVPDSGDRFLLTFMPGELRTVTREGVELFSLRYQSQDLTPLVCPRRKRMVRFDPRDISRVFVEAEDRHVVANLIGTAIPPMSIWEWREVRAQQVEQGRTRDPEAVAAEILANRSLIATKAAQGARLRDARREARQQSWEQVQGKHQQSTSVLPLKPLSSARPCRVEE